MPKPNALESETRPAIPTEDAARLLCRSPQTLRQWACYGDGPIRPIRVHRRLMWPVEEIRRLLNGGGQQPEIPSDASTGVPKHLSPDKKKRKPAETVRRLQMVFRGTHSFTFHLPPIAIAQAEGNFNTEEVPGFEAVWVFGRLERLRIAGQPSFSHAQAICVAEVKNWNFPGRDSTSVLVSHKAIRWILCFPLIRQELRQQRGSRTNGYAPLTCTVPSDGSDVFYTFSSAIQSDAPVRAVAYWDSFRFLSPQPDDKLVVIRASNWTWNECGHTVSIQPWDVLEVETVIGSNVHVS